MFAEFRRSFLSSRVNPESRESRGLIDDTPTPILDASLPTQIVSWASTNLLRIRASNDHFLNFNYFDEELTDLKETLICIYQLIKE